MTKARLLPRVPAVGADLSAEEARSEEAVERIDRAVAAVGLCNVAATMAAVEISADGISLPPHD